MIEYRIAPSITETGEPTWELIREWSMHFGCGVKSIAKNADRAVLEAAIEHLSQGKRANEVKP
jgi:hypothetical protein